MRSKFIFPLLMLAAAAVLAACNSADRVASSNSQKPQGAGPETVYADGARRITIDELDDMMKAGTAVVIDVRNQAAYDQGHIPGSRLIPAGEIANHLSELPRDKMIVTYCS